MTDHYVTWTIGGGTVDAGFHCAAEIGAACRLWCAAPFERQCDEIPCVHGSADQGECLVMVWLANDGATPADLYTGPKTKVRPGPIVTTWDGHGYTWRYRFGED